MANSNSGKHARKVTLDAAVSNAIAKAVDARKVAAFTVGAAGVLAGAAFAFGATPAMAAENGVTPDTKTAPVTVDENAGVDAGNAAGVKDDAKPEDNKADENNKAGENAQSDTNKEAGEQTEKKVAAEEKAEQSVVNSETTDVKAAAYAADAGTDRASNGDIKEVAFSSQTGEMPNVYGFGTVDNQYDDQLANNPITFKLPKQQDDNGADKAVTRVTVFPSPSNHINTPRTSGSIDFDSDNNGHQPYSGEYVFNKNKDGSATLTMNRIFRKDERGDSKGIKNAQGYSATRSIQINPTPIPGSAKEDAVSDQFRAALLVPPKSAGTIVKKVSDIAITENDVNNAMDYAKKNGKTTHVGKSGIDGLSLEEQIQALSNKLGKRKLDTIDEKIPTSNNEYDKTALTKANNKVGVSIVDTHFVTDLGFKSQAIPLTIVRYNDVIDKPVVEDPTNLSQDVKNEIAQKLAKINGVTPDKISFVGDEAVIGFDGVDEKDAPKIKLSDLVLKKLKDGEFAVPSNDKAVFVANPLGYSNAELDRIKQAIFDANKENKDLGLTSKDQITLEYVKGDTTVGHENIGISNGQAENTITVKIKTDKAVAEFTSDIKANKLTKLPNIRTDYDVTWTKTTIDGRDTDEGISWSDDQKKTTIIYRYDPTKAEEFDTTKILGLLKATPKDKQAGLRELTGGEQLTYEGTGTHSRKSHMNYALQNEEPTGELTLGNMGGAYWSGNQKVSNSDVDLGDNLSIAGLYSWDPEAGQVKVAGKEGKIFKARLFVEPYAMTYYKDVYLEKNRHPGNTVKAINVIFVPQTNHKTKDLKTSVEEHKTETVGGNEVPTQSAYYNASKDKKDAYDKALQTAKNLYESVKGIDESKLTEDQKAQIDNATINLNKAREALDGDVTKKEELQKSINENGKAAEAQTPATAGTVTTDKYKNVTEPDFKDANGNADTKKNEDAKKAKTAYDSALAEANKVNSDKNATQKAVDDAKAKLDAARKELDKYSTNKDELNNAIAKDGKVDTGRDAQGNQTLTKADPTYQNSSKAERTAYDNAVTEANKVAADPNASQKDVNEAIKKLKDAKDALDKNATDKAPLDAAVQKSFDNPKPDDESQQSVFYTNAKNKAKDSSASEADKQAAQKAIDDYDKALKKAKDVLADKKATKKDVEDAKKALEDAEAALHADTYQTKDTDLAQALADNFSGYLMPAYFNAFDKAQADDEQAKKDFKAYNDAYHAAKDLMAKLKTPGSTIKQTDVDKVKDQLVTARKIIDAYATDTSRLSAAALNDLAIQKSPAYTNLKELAEKQNPSEEEKAKVEAAKKAKEAYDKAVDKLHKALSNTLDKDKDAQGNPLAKIPDAKEDPTSKNYLDGVQAHANGEPLNKDVDAIVKEMNEAAAELNKFATKTDKLLESINKDTDTQHDPAYKNTKDPHKLGADGQEDKTEYGTIMQKAKDYDDALTEAKKLLTDPAATQAQVDAALKKLNEKRDALKAQDTNVEALKSSVEKHGKEKQGNADATEGTVTSDAYRNASDPHFMKADTTDPTKLVEDTEKNDAAKEAKKAYDKALAEAQELLKKAGPNSNTPLDAQPTQRQIDDALKKLDDARTEVEKYTTVTTDLETEINKSTAEHAPAVTENDFENTPEFKNANDKNDNKDVKTYNDALKKARDLVKAANPTDPGAKNSSHPTQQEINDALDALKAAKKQITDNYKTNLEPLTSAKDFAGGDFKKTPEYKNAAALKDDQKADQNTKDAAKKVVEALDDSVADSALKKAKDIIDNPTGKTQKEVDAALKTLQEAMEAVTNGYKTKTDKLENEVGDKDAQGQPVTPKFEESVAYKNALAKKNAESEEDAKKDGSATKKLEDYNKKLKAAQDLIAQVNSTDPNADPDKKPTQKQVDAALEALKKAKQAIDDAFTTKVDALKKETKELNDDGGAKEDKDKFENSAEYQNALAKTDADGKKDVQTYKDALKKANDLLGKFDENGKPKPGEKDIPTQQEVDAALDVLKAAKKKITDGYKTNKSDLTAEAGKDSDFTKTPEYQNAQANGDDESKKALEDYKKALEDANKVLGDANATQAQVDEALKKLQDAKKKLTDSNKTDKSKLQTEADDDAKFRKSLYFIIGKRDDIEAYKKALAEADSVLNDPNATQAQVDEALRKLQAAKYKLNHPFGAGSGVGSGSGYDTDADAGDGFDTSDSQSASVDKSALQVEVNNSEADSSAASKSNTAAAKAYVSALAEAKRVLADKNATQAQVDEALRKLQAAKAAWRNASGASGNASALAKTGAATGLFASLAAVFSGLGAAGVASRRRKHSNE